MKKRKIKWGNVFKAIILLNCIGLVIHDFYYITIKLYSWTWLGFITFILATVVGIVIYDDFEEQIKNIPSYKPRHAKDIK